MDDTSFEITEKMGELIRAKTPAERYKMGWSMYETSKCLITRAILENHPNLSKAAFQKEIFLKFYGDDFDLSARERILDHFDKIFS
jgi:hypothetical protein